MAESGADILPQEKTKVERCGTCVKFPQNSVKEATKTRISYMLVVSSSPEGYFPISATLSCSPAFEGLKDARVKLPIFCSTSERVDCAIFRKEHTDSWTLLDDSHPLTHEKHLELHYRNIDNITAFLPIDRLKDVEFHIVCFQLISTDGRYAVGFCADDQAIRKAFLHRMKKEGVTPISENMDSLAAKISDVIKFEVPSENRCQFLLKELLLTETQSRICYDDLGEIVEEQEYRIVQQRVEAENLATVFQKSYTIQPKELEEPCSSLEIQGGLEARNVLVNLQDSHLDMREYTHDDVASPVSEKEPHKEECKTSHPSIPTNRENKSRFKGRGVKTVIKGGIKAKTAVMNSSNLSIDMRTYTNKSDPQTKDGKESGARVALENVDEAGNVGNAAEPIWKNADNEDGARNEPDELRRRTHPATVGQEESYEADRQQYCGESVNVIASHDRLDHLHIALLTLLVLCTLWIFYKFIL